MNREERRRAERDARRAGRRPEGSWGSRLGMPEGRLTTDRTYEPSDFDRQVQDFVAGTVFAAGATLLGPVPPQPGENSDGLPPPVFAVMIDPDDLATFTVAPVLRDVLAERDRIGSEALGSKLTCASSWSWLTHPDGQHAMAKLKLDFIAPVKGSARILLLAENYAPMWQYIQPGGIVGVTTMDRIQRVALKPGGPTFADGIEACVPIGIASSPGLRRIIDAFGWPSDYLG